MVATWAWQILTCATEPASAAAWASLAVMRSRPGPGSRRVVGSRSGVELVQVPAQPVDRPGGFGDQVLAMVDQQLDLPGRLVLAGGGQIGLAQGGAGDRQGVDRVGLALDPDRLAGAGHQPGRHPHHPLPGGQQVAFQPAGDVPAVLHGPPALVGPAVACPAEQLGVAEGARRDGGLAELTAGLIDGHDGVGVLVRINPEQHHGGVSFVRGDLGSAGGHTSVGALPRSSQATPVGPRHGRDGTT
jgi:hypothetical protein